MATKTISNLFSNFDEVGTEANAEIIKNSINSNKKINIKNNFNQNLTNSKKILDEISTSSKPINNKLETLAAKLPKKIVDKKSYMTIYLKKSIQIKIDEMAKKLGVSNGSIIELLINEFEQK